MQGKASSLPLGLPVFGEMALVDRSLRTESAVVTSDSKLLVLPLEEFASCTLAVPDIKTRLRRMREQRKALHGF